MVLAWFSHGDVEDIIPPPSIKQAMEMEAEAERRRRAEVLQSEGDRQSEVNLAEGLDTYIYISRMYT